MNDRERHDRRGTADAIGGSIRTRPRGKIRGPMHPPSDIPIMHWTDPLRIARWLVLLVPATCMELGCRKQSGPAPNASVPAPTLADRFGAQPFLALIEPGEGMAMKGGGQLGLKASDCGGCHVDIYLEWQQATHAAAIRDLQFAAELSKPDNPRWLCLNCHIPLQPQRPYRVQWQTRTTSSDGLSIERVPDPSFDEHLAAEAITCATCHVRPGPDGRGVVIGPNGRPDAPHEVRRDPAALRGTCVRCHSPGNVVLSPTLVCWFETAEELAAGPDAAQHCVDCHMPAVERPLVPQGQVRQTRHHFWTGGGVPKSFDRYDTLIERGWRPGIDVEIDDVVRGASATQVRMTLHNARGGHMVPTADPERHLWIDARLLEADGREVGRAAHRIGQHWDFGDASTGRRAHKLSDNRLAPDERRKLVLDVPGRGSTLVVQIRHVRMTPGIAEYSQRAQPPDEVRALAPDAPAQLPALASHYPMFTYVFAERRDLETGQSDRDDLATLVARSIAAQTWSLDRHARELATSTPPPK